MEFARAIANIEVSFLYSSSCADNAFHLGQLEDVRDFCSPISRVRSLPHILFSNS